jgi:hypothetical protein
MSTFMIRVSLVSTLLFATMTSSCSMLTGLLGGLTLSGESEGDLFMSGNETAKSAVPYHAQPSNSAKAADDSGLIYGKY